MTLLLINTDQRTAEHIMSAVSKKFPDTEIEIDPSVYVVEYESINGPAVFLRREDAEVFDQTFVTDDHSIPPGVQRVTIADAKVASEMISDRNDES